MVRRLIPFLVCCGLPAASLTYSNYLRDNLVPAAIASDASGNIYLAATAIVDPGRSQTTVLVVKLNPQATGYLWQRFLGGSVRENASAIAVDTAGNVYVAGTTNSPDFPITGGNLGTPPVMNSERSFVAKFDAAGILVFSTLLGSVNSFTQAVAVNAAGQVLVSGVSVEAGFPATPGVYNVSNTSFAPYLLELDATGTKLLFSATGIGGNAIAFDAAGNIYMAGTTNSLTYPTTPGTYQPNFPVFQTCIAPCHGMFQGPNQYVTKLDSTGTKMIFSTAVSGTGNTMNEGLAVDTDGNVYLTGLAGPGYPFTVTPPVAPSGPALAQLSTPSLPFLTKLDPLGQKLLYSVPVGGMGVQVDSNGLAYVGGVLGAVNLYSVNAALPALSNGPSGCFVPATTVGKSAYTAQVDGGGNVLGAQYIGGSTLTLSGVTLAGGTLWVAGGTLLADFPLTPNRLVNSGPSSTQNRGAYLGATTFAIQHPAAGTPQVTCVVDSANLEPAGPIVANELLTIFGNGLGPATPVTATDLATTSLGGVSVTFDSVPATLLYVSANQINLAVPAVRASFAGTTMQVSVNGAASAPLQFDMTAERPSLFAVPGAYIPQFEQFNAVAVNADGSMNSASNPAPLGSEISVFVNGSGSNSLPLLAGSGWKVTAVAPLNPFVLQVGLQVPSTTANMACPAAQGIAACFASFSIVDPVVFYGGPQASGGGFAVGGVVYVGKGTP